MLFRGDLVHCLRLGELEILHDHLICKQSSLRLPSDHLISVTLQDVNEQGFIAFIGSLNSAESSRLLEQYGPQCITIPAGSFLLPTFCDLHLHAPQYLYQGTGLHLPLMQWLDQYAFKAEELLDSDPVLANKVYSRLAERLVENGTGAVLLFGTIKQDTNLILAEIMQHAGIRAFVGKLSMDMSSRPSYVESSALVSIAAARSFIDECRGLWPSLPSHQRLVEPVITPRFVPTCSEELLKGLGELAKEKNVRIQSHLAEAHDQVAWVKHERGVNDIDVFDRNGLLTLNTIQAHCTFLTPACLERLASKGTAVAHCPLSNAYFSAKPFPLRESLRRNVKVGLGSDIAGGYSLDIGQAMRHTVTTARMRNGGNIMKGKQDSRETSVAIDWKESLYLATHGGAVALSLPSGCGSFVVGAPFDAQCISVFNEETGYGIGPLDFFTDHRQSEVRRRLDEGIIEKWWCCGDARNRVGVWVQGAKLM